MVQGFKVQRPSIGAAVEKLEGGKTFLPNRASPKAKTTKESATPQL
jgi:hypothetical protein